MQGWLLPCLFGVFTLLCLAQHEAIFPRFLTPTTVRAWGCSAQRMDVVAAAVASAAVKPDTETRVLRAQRSAIALASPDELRHLPPSLQHLEVAVLAPGDGALRDLGEAVQHLGALRTLRLRANMRRLTIREDAFRAGPIAHLQVCGARCTA